MPVRLRSPAGLVPELLLQELIAKRCDYYFCRLCTHTDRMMVSCASGKPQAAAHGMQSAWAGSSYVRA